MTAAALIDECRRAGVALTLDGAGGLAYRGDREAVSRLLPAIRQHKPALLAALAGKPAVDVETMAASLAAEFGTTPEYCLSLLDADDRRAIASGSDPGRAGAWRTAVHLAAAQPPTAPATALDGEDAIYPAPVVCWTPAGFPVAVEARDEKHAGQLRRWNPRPARLALASTSAGLRS